jgi:hypothetical protein
MIRPCGSVVEHTLGKGEVTSSILVTGFISNLFLEWVLLYLTICLYCKPWLVYFGNLGHPRPSHIDFGSYIWYEIGMERRDFLAS